MRKRIRSAIVLVAALALLAVLGAAVALAENIDPGDDGSQYAWGENVGWLNAEPANCSDCGVHVWDDCLEGYMWGENIGWISLSCENTGSCVSGVGYGVLNDNGGNLTDYAWAENVGWISFSCKNTGSCDDAWYAVDIDPLTGEFSGYAWGENIGWISFDLGSQAAYGVKTSWTSPCPGGGDTDSDGWDDEDEWYMTTDCLDPCSDAPGDRDAWAPDFDLNGVCDVTDALTFLPAFPSAEGTANYSPRKNMAPEAPGVPGVIDVVDALIFLPHFPSACPGP